MVNNIEIEGCSLDDEFLEDGMVVFVAPLADTLVGESELLLMICENIWKAA